MPRMRVFGAILDLDLDDLVCIESVLDLCSDDAVFESAPGHRQDLAKRIHAFIGAQPDKAWRMGVQEK